MGISQTKRTKRLLLKIIYLNLNTSPFDFQIKFIFLELCILGFEKKTFFVLYLKWKSKLIFKKMILLGLNIQKKFFILFYLIRAFVLEMKNVLRSNDSLIKVQHIYEHLFWDFVNLFEKFIKFVSIFWINLFWYISFKVNKNFQISFSQNLMILECLKLKILDF